MNINPSEYKILIVDDVQTNVLLMKALLGKEKYALTEAISGEQALEVVGREHPDLILLDVMMPGMDGFEVASILKADPAFEAIPIIFLTALDDTDSIVKGFKLGASDFISKPFRKEELMIRIGHQLSLVEAKRTILKQTEELQKTIAGRDKLYSVIAHDLRSPMASMKMLLNTIMMSLDKSAVDENVFDMLEMSNRTSEEVFTLLDNLLKWTKSQLGKLTVVPQGVDIVGMIAGVVQVSESVAAVKGIKISVDAAMDSCMIVVDVEMIKCVIRNLLSNAIKFSHKNSTILISVTEDNESVIVSVKDTGKGIKKEDQHKLLQETTHFTTYGTNREEGSGLGLLLCMDFVAKNNGKFWFDSEEDVGSCFNFSILKANEVK